MLSADDGNTHDALGWSVALQGDFLVAGAPFDDDLGNETGSVYAFERQGGTWSQADKLLPGGTNPPGQFGSAVALDGHWALSGAPYDNWAGATSGSAYAFYRTPSGWQQRQKLVAGDAHSSSAFGSSLALEGTLAAIGAESDDSLYLFEYESGFWVQVEKLVTPPTGYARFGAAVDLDAGTLAIGAPVGGSNDTGVVWIGEPMSGATPYCVAAPNSAGPGASMGSQGAPSVSANDFRLQVSGAPSIHFGLFYFGAAETLLPFGNGFVCVAPPHYRLLPPLMTDASGSASRVLDLTTPPAWVIAPGSTWRFQFWYRDSLGGGSLFNLSDGLEIRFCE